MVCSLRLEKPCMEHMQYLVVRSHNQEGLPFHHPLERSDDAEFDHMSGHALMASCPPYSHVMEKPGESYPHRMPEMHGIDLNRLLEAAKALPIQGDEVPPVSAWMMVKNDERFPSMTKRDHEMLLANLASKVRCYG